MKRRNPFLVCMFVLAALALGVGLILQLVGAQLAADNVLYDPLAGVAQSALGAQLAPLGFLGLLLALGAAAVTWRPAPAVKREPAYVDTL